MSQPVPLVPATSVAGTYPYPNDLPPWAAVYQQAQRWLKAGVFEAIVRDLRRLLRVIEGRPPDPSAAILDNRTLQSTPESGLRAGYDGAKRKRGSKVHVAVDTLGHLLALHVTAADQQDRAQVRRLARRLQAATGDTVQLAFVDQGYTGEAPAQEAARQGIQLEVVKLPYVKRASCCCRADGSWSAASPGRRVSAGWPATMNDCLRRWLGFISWRSPS